ncbi:MAG: hypothetical protein E7291_02850 [Lachnospiraceae bacterium]|nr:hypothetical protein [Lachnospiraceae bacterium]
MTLEQSIYKDDFAGVKEVCEKVWNTGEKMYVTYRVFRRDETTHWVIASIDKTWLAGEAVLELNLQSVDDLEQELASMQESISEYGSYMGILDEIFFKYDIETDDLCLFMGGNNQKVVVYNGSLDS